MKTILKQIAALRDRDLRHLQDQIFAEIQRRRELLQATPSTEQLHMLQQSAGAERDQPLSPLRARTAGAHRPDEPRRAA